jgi:hypothetical protein
VHRESDREPGRDAGEDGLAVQELPEAARLVAQVSRQTAHDVQQRALQRQPELAAERCEDAPPRARKPADQAPIAHCVHRGHGDALPPAQRTRGEQHEGQDRPDHGRRRHHQSHVDPDQGVAADPVVAKHYEEAGHCAGRPARQRDGHAHAQGLLAAGSPPLLPSCDVAGADERVPQGRPPSHQVPAGPRVSARAPHTVAAGPRRRRPPTRGSRTAPSHLSVCRGDAIGAARPAAPLTGCGRVVAASTDKGHRVGIRRRVRVRGRSRWDGAAAGSGAHARTGRAGCAQLPT